MKITSPAFQNNQQIPPKYTCDGEAINPPLIFDSEEDLSPVCFALIMDDPDAPSGTFTHWLIWNINGDCDGVPEAAVPLGGIQGMNSGGKTGYYPPCPPSGTHRYFFKLFALDIKLNLQEGASRIELEKAMNSHIIGKTELIGTYSRR